MILIIVYALNHSAAMRFESPQATRGALAGPLPADLNRPDERSRVYLRDFAGAVLPFTVMLDRQGRIHKRLLDLFAANTLVAALRNAGESDKQSMILCVGQYPVWPRSGGGLGDAPWRVYGSLITATLPQQEPVGPLTAEVRVQACHDSGRCLTPDTARARVIAP